jgi:hypothetical protein
MSSLVVGMQCDTSGRGEQTCFYAQVSGKVNLIFAIKMIFDYFFTFRAQKAEDDTRM